MFWYNLHGADVKELNVYAKVYRSVFFSSHITKLREIIQAEILNYLIYWAKYQIRVFFFITLDVNIFL